MKNIYLVIILKAIMIIFIAGCKKDTEVNYYPDCFAGLQSAPNSDGVGCGNLVEANLSEHQIITIGINETNLGVTTKCKTFDISKYANDIKIYYYTYGHHPDSVYFSDYCNDVLGQPINNLGTKIKWTATSGKVTVAVSYTTKPACEEYKISIALANIKFIKENSTQDTTLISLIIKDASVGRCVP
ncbi:MAG: hypothetical protein ACHQNT_04830 [Bacteroidia bacterium]